METGKIQLNYSNGINFLLTGVGGQGTILASNVLADLGLALEFDVKKAEIHGMSQRGGNVISFIRWGKKVFSPIISQGEVDILIAFEKLEVLRSIDQIRKQGLVLINDYSIVPVTVSSGMGNYPTDEEIKNAVGPFTSQHYWIKGVKIAEDIGYPKASNVVLLGSLAALTGIDSNKFLKVIANRIAPKYYAFNEQAFLAGWEAINEQN